MTSDMTGPAVPAGDEPEPEPLTQEELDRAAVEAEDAADALDGVGLTDAEAESGTDELLWARDAERDLRRTRLAPMRTRILNYLRDEAGDEWALWPDVVEAVDIKGRSLADISPINGRMRQAALALWRDGLLEIQYGRVSVFAAVRLLPAGYTSDRKD